MARKKQSKGKCIFCDKMMTKGGLSRHLSSCKNRQTTIDATNQKNKKILNLYHLQIQDAWNSDFWLHLEMKGTAKLADLDNYLRAIWLECCGHMSEFSTGNWGSKGISKSKQAEQVFNEGVKLTHIYDFGTSSETLITVVGVRKGIPLTKHPIFLMARNNLPEVPCTECSKPATHLCMECISEFDEPGTLCDEHTENHPHDDYGEPTLLVNSPRMGMCGYDGPADPPY